MVMPTPTSSPFLQCTLSCWVVLPLVAGFLCAPLVQKMFLYMVRLLPLGEQDRVLPSICHLPKVPSKASKCSTSVAVLVEIICYHHSIMQIGFAVWGFSLQHCSSCPFCASTCGLQMLCKTNVSCMQSLGFMGISACGFGHLLCCHKNKYLVLSCLKMSYPQIVSQFRVFHREHAPHHIVCLCCRHQF